jgi:hypothetical protein
MGATNRLPSQRLQHPFSADVAKMTLDLSDSVVARRMQPRLRKLFGKSASVDRRENPAGTRHIRAIAVAESFQHHSLFPGNAAKKQSPKTDQARETGNPVRQQ